MKKENDPKKKAKEKGIDRQPPDTREPASSEKTAPAPARKSQTETSDKPSEEETIRPWQKPITNQDEQEKITNAGGDDIPITEE